MIHPHLACLVPELNPQLDIRRQGFGFLLGQCGHDGHENLALCIKRVYVLLLEINGNVECLKFPCVFQAVNRISGESTNGLCDDHIDFAIMAIRNHAVE